MTYVLFIAEQDSSKADEMSSDTSELSVMNSPTNTVRSNHYSNISFLIWTQKQDLSGFSFFNFLKLWDVVIFAHQAVQSLF